MKKIIMLFFILANISFASNNPRELYNDMGLDGKIKYKVFEKAIIGYNKISNKNPGVIGIVDYTKPSTEKRFFLIDLNSKSLIKHTLVSHAKNTGVEMPVNFSNVVFSFQNSLGFYLTGGTYSGDYGHSLRLKGLEQNINSNAERRAIVMHGGAFAEEDYIKRHGFLGRSLGCPVLPLSESREIIEILKDGRVLFIAGNDDDYEELTKF